MMSGIVSHRRNETALKLTPAPKSFEILIRKAAWLGKGKATTPDSTAVPLPAHEEEAAKGETAVAHDLGREIQIAAYVRDRWTTEKRASHCQFECFHRLRHRVLQRARRLSHLNRRLPLTLNANDAPQQEITPMLDSQIET